MFDTHCCNECKDNPINKIWVPYVENFWKNNIDVDDCENWILIKSMFDTQLKNCKEDFGFTLDTHFEDVKLYVEYGTYGDIYMFKNPDWKASKIAYLFHYLDSFFGYLLDFIS